MGKYVSELKHKAFRFVIRGEEAGQLAVLYNTAVISDDEIHTLLKTGKISEVFRTPDARFILSTFQQVSSILNLQNQQEGELHIQHEIFSIHREGSDEQPHHLAVLFNTDIISEDEIRELIETGEILGALYQPDDRFIISTVVQVYAVLNLPLPEELKEEKKAAIIEIDANGAKFA